jgi:hypothetical protein
MAGAQFISTSRQILDCLKAAQDDLGETEVQDDTDVPEYFELLSTIVFCD